MRNRCIGISIQEERLLRKTGVALAALPTRLLTTRADAGSRQLLAVQLFAFVFEDQHRVEFIRADVIEAEVYAQLERGPEIQSAPDEESGLRRLRPVEPVERAVVTPVAVVGRVGAERRVAEFVPAQGPMDQESQGGLLWPLLPAYEFGSPDSWNPASSASMAAFTATAWCMIGASPA